MTITLKETPSQRLAQAHQRLKAYDQYQRKSRRYRNIKIEYTRKSRSLSPLSHRRRQVLHSKEVQNGLPLILSYKDITGTQAISKIPTSESVTLSPRSVGSEQWIEKNQELKQRQRHNEVVKEIKTRAKQIALKQNTCMIIKQAGHKIRVNNDILAIGRQKYLKKQINIVIRQGGLKARIQKEIRQLRVVAKMITQKKLKAQVNLSIRQIAKAHIHKRRVCMVLKQTGLKAKCNMEIRRYHNLLRQGPTFSLKVQSESDKQIDNGDSRVFDDKDSVYGDSVSKKGIAVMKLVDCVTKANKLKEQQDRDIRALTAELIQQKVDFAALTKRFIEDKHKLYEKMENLKEENASLVQILAKKEKEELVMAMQKAHEKVMKRQSYNTQRQQAPQFYQEMQEFNIREKIQHSPTREDGCLTQIIF